MAVEKPKYKVITLGSYSVKTKLIAIGNARGVRLPKPLIEEAGLENEVEIRARKGEIVIRPLRKPRSGWAEAAKLAHDSKEDVFIDQETTLKVDKAT